MNHIEPLNGIGRYLERYASDRANGLDEWEVFWDYRCGIHADGGSVFTEPHVDAASARLVSYLFFYGMGRGSTRLLAVRSSRRFAHVLEAISTAQGQELLQTDFATANWMHPPFASVWNDVGTALREVGASDTETMRSKILLAVWGGMPALDSRFNTVFKATWGVQRRPPRCQVLACIQERHAETWRNEIESAPDAWVYTSGGNRIPDARLLDIAFWYHGE